MSKNLILVTGATGDTGGFTIDHLLSKGAHVRALVHQDDERAHRLRSKGVDVVVGDLLDFHAVAKAMEGVHAAYFVYPIRPQLIDATVYFAQAAKEAKVQAIVNMSQISARRDAVSHAAQNHWLSERIFDWAGTPVTHIRPTFFMEWLLYDFQRPFLVDHDTIRVPGGNGRHAPIAASDQGRLIASILLDPVPHAGKTYPLCGPIELNYTEIAKAVGDALGREIKYEAESLKDFEARAQKNVPPFLAQHLAAVMVDYQNGIFAGTDDIIEKTTGTPPLTVQQFVDANRSAFQRTLP